MAQKKLVVWDGDGTLYPQTLGETSDGVVTLRPDVVAEIKRLDSLGILHSIASRNDHDIFMAMLEANGIADYFLYPQINWGVKSDSITEIVRLLNIGMDAVAFVDDRSVERGQVAHALPEVMTIDIADIGTALHGADFQPRFPMPSRREKYLQDARRHQSRREFSGTDEEFLATLGMRLSIAHATEEDLQRAVDLTERTHQLNATGTVYSYDDLKAKLDSPTDQLLVMRLIDREGDLGTIGLSLIERDPAAAAWSLRLMIMSCRVVPYGIGTIVLNYLKARARDQGVQLFADFVDTGRNGLMRSAYAFNGFREINRDVDGRSRRLIADLCTVQPIPPYIRLEAAL
jgi:FkbH-like protein